MPADYLKVRDSCYERKRKKNNGELSEEDKAECKKMAAIIYYKKHGKPVQHSESFSLPDEIDLNILIEQLDYFGTLENYQRWEKGDSHDGHQK